MTLIALAPSSAGSEPEPPSWNRFGAALAIVSDVDADGIGELVIGDPAFRDPEGRSVGRIVVVSPSNGDVVWSAAGTGRDVSGLGLALTPVDDLDGDGWDDVVAAGGRDGAFVLLALGSGGAMLWELPVPHVGPYSVDPSLCTLDDLDGDGVRDLVVGLGSAGAEGERRGAVWWVSGRSGEVLREDVGSAEHGHYGWRVAPAGDVDGDGSTDLLVCAAGDAEVGQAVHVVASSGETLRVHAWPGSGRLLLSAASVDDMDGDGCSDLAVAWEDCAVVAYSGRTGAAIRTWSTRRRGGTHNVSGSSLVGIGDVDGDGITELAVGLPQSIVRDGPCAWVLRGDGENALLGILSNLEEGDHGRLDACFGYDRWIWDSQPGTSLAAVGDVDGDGSVDVAVGSSSSRCFECTGAVGLWSPSRGVRLRLFTACDVR